jgi:DNA-binding NarL/FixJ family response regulator
VIQVLIIDDHPLVHDGIKTMLKGEKSIQIMASIKTAREALTFLETNNPDIILLDISLPDMNGLDLCEEIRSTKNHAKIIGLTSTNEAGIITGFLQRGGNGYLLKNMEREELLEAIETVSSGQVHLSKAANAKILEQFQKPPRNEHSPMLTRREQEILQLLSDGLNGPQISEKLFISPLTIETHRKNLFKKFNATSVQHLLKIARDFNLVK